MSKAFTKEDADVPEAPITRRGIPVPETNLVTAEGLVAARAELEELSRAGGAPDRVAELTAHLATARVAVPDDRGEVGIGATVTLETTAGKQTTYRIVGAIEADPKHGALGWQSPLAEALRGGRVGDTAILPNGAEVEIVAIAYRP